MGSAIISDCGKYRYRLERDLGGGGPTVAFIMVNPSTADADQDDPTIRKCIGFAKKLGAGRLIVGNKFAFRSTDIDGLRSAADPVGPENDEHLARIIHGATLHIAAWGSLNKIPEVLRKRWHAVVHLADRSGVHLHAIGINADGHPKHPLMTGYGVPVTPWPVPWFAGRKAAA